MPQEKKKKVSFDAAPSELNRFASKLALNGVKPSAGLRALISAFNRDGEVQDKVFLSAKRRRNNDL
jgi:hypothetical protein